MLLKGKNMKKAYEEFSEDKKRGYIIYFVCGILIALCIKFVWLRIILFIPVWYISLQFAHRVMPCIVNRTLGKFMGIE